MHIIFLDRPTTAAPIQEVPVFTELGISVSIQSVTSCTGRYSVTWSPGLPAALQRNWEADDEVDNRPDE